MDEVKKEQQPSTFTKARGNKKVRLLVIGILILVAVYMLYSVL